MMQMLQKISALARRSLTSLLLALAASAAVGAAVQGKGAGEPQLFGLWSNPAGSVTIRINGCGTEVCGTVAKANADQLLVLIDGRSVYTQTFSGVAVNHCEHSKLASIKQIICNKVHAPDLIDMLRQFLWLSKLSGLVALGTLLPQ